MSMIQNNNMLSSQVSIREDIAEEGSKFSELKSKLEGISKDPMVSGAVEIVSGGCTTGSSLLVLKGGVQGLVDTFQVSAEVTEDVSSAVSDVTKQTLSEVGGMLGGVFGGAIAIFNMVKTSKEIKSDLAKIAELKESRAQELKEEASKGADPNILDMEDVPEGPSLDKQIKGLWMSFAGKILKMIAGLVQVLAALAKIIQSIVNLAKGGDSAGA